MSATESSLAPTVGAIFERAVRDFGSRTIEIFDSRGRSGGRTNFTDLDQRLRLAGRRLRALGVSPGDRVVVSLSSSWEWFDAWFGTLFAGGLPVSVAPPGAMGSPAAQIDKTLRVCRQLDARLLVAPENFDDELARQDDLDPASFTTALLVPETIAATLPADPDLPGLDTAPEATAFLQLTSGSTGLPRAVEIAHASVAHNTRESLRAIAAATDRPLDQWQTMVSWLPLYHDMGLIGGIFFSLVNGLDLRLLPPRAFLARPHLWLRELARSGPCLSPAPNFGYQLCAERVSPAQLEGLDLSGWGAALTGSEMVRPETMEAFSRVVEPHGFVPSSAIPCYGMAETTLAITFDPRGEGVRTRPLPAEADPDSGLREVVSNGLPIADTELRIVGPDGRRRPADRIGEVQVRGPGVFKGYWQEPEATAAVLRDGWLATGDLGFLDGDGELYLTGRLKEILIVRGQNLMPHELEWIAEEITGGGGALRAAAFSVTPRDHEEQGEQAVLVVETAAEDDERRTRLGHDIASAVGRRLGLPLADLVLVRRGSIPRTSSGKVQRRQLRERYLRGELGSG